jgi:multicomponent Na+:H+ antiporter subunit A
VYLLARLTPALGGTPQWHTLITLFGLATLLAGAFLALGQTDLKRLLAYTTVASLGTMVFLIGLGDSLAIKSAITLILAHALYKGALFFVAGGIDHSAHTRDLNRLGGLAGTMPFTAFAAVLAGLSMLGLPPALGFISKELVYEAALESTSGGNTLVALIALSGVTAVGIWVAFLPFWKKPDEQTARGHGEEIALWLPPVLLGLISLGLGLLPGIASKALVQPAVEAVLLKSTPVKLALWHGFTPMLALSGLTLAIGTVLALNRMRFQPAVQTILQALAPISPERGYERGLTGLKHFAALQTNFLQNGYFRRYLLVTILSGILLVGIVLLQSDSLPWTSFTPTRFYEVILVGVILTGVFTVTRTASRMTAAALLGMMGFTIALIYLLYSAPDLAMVQFTIETLSVILFVLVIYRLPQFTRTRGGSPAVLDVVVSVAAGVLVTVLVLTLSAVPHDSLVTPFYAENSLKLAQGRNMVNVILVDFRGFDTLGEITVLALAGIGVFALLKLSGKTEAIRTSSQEETK